MNHRQHLSPLMHQLDLLTRVIHESPYLSCDCRKGLEQEIDQLTEKFEEGSVSFLQGEQTIEYLNKRAATDEIINLISKIYYLNPSSSRLETLRDISRQLGEGGVSPEQVRVSINQIMQT